MIEPYNPNWKIEFEKLKAIFTAALMPFHPDVQHVGSTAIPGLCAKPILDIDLIVTDKAHVAAISQKLEQMGYLNRGEQGIAGRFAFRQTSDYTPTTGTKQKWQAHHLYVCLSDSLALKNHLLFRDALLHDHSLTGRYADLKMTLMNERGITREEYTKRKTDFILSVLSTLGLDAGELEEILQANK